MRKFCPGLASGVKQSSRAPEHEEDMTTFYEDSECEGIQLLSECFDAEECMVEMVVVVLPTSSVSSA